MFKFNNILITGGNGFIGRNLVKKIKENHPKSEITVLDLKANERPTKNVKFITHDLAKEPLKLKEEYDLIIHAAALLGVDNVIQDPLGTIFTNIIMLKNLETSLTNNCHTKLVFFSTSEVYDAGKKIAEDNQENDVNQNLLVPNLKHPRSSYALSKIIGEFWANQHGNYLIVRPHNIYGRQMGDRHVIPSLIQKIKKSHSQNEFLQLQNYNHVRSFCFVEDAIDQVIWLLNKEKSGCFNIGNSKEPTTIYDLAVLISNKIGVDNTIIKIGDTDVIGSTSFRKPVIIPELTHMASTTLSEGVGLLLD